MRPSFLSYYTARSGIEAARTNLQITGQNMTNANTEGYTRQRIDQYSVGASSANARYSLNTDAYLGEGVSIGGVSQIRDTYLDVHYRRENCKVGDTAAQLEALNDLENIFDETLEEGLMAQFSDLKAQLETLAQNTGDSVVEKVVQTSSMMLVKMFNQYSDQIQVAKERQLSNFENGGIDQVNELLDSIAYLNGEIKNSHAGGNPALELQDQRNGLIDQLSEYLNIEVDVKQVTIGKSLTIDELSIQMVGADGEKYSLVNNDEARSFELVKDSDGNTTFPVSIRLLEASGRYVTGSNDFQNLLQDGEITEEISSGSFGGFLKMLNDAGEFDDPPTTSRGIMFYDNMLNTLASTFADLMNQANSSNGTEPYDKPLFEASDGGAITAATLSLSEKWTNATDSYISTSSEDVLKMVDMFNQDIAFETETTGTSLFKGNIEEFLTNISSVLALETESITRDNTTYSNNVVGIDEQRASVTGVSLDEEGINLVMFNQSLTAASRFMTTIDEAMDLIINRMGLVGR